MPSTYSTKLRLEMMATGEKGGLWGAITNTNVGTLLEQAIAGVRTISISGNYTLSALDGADDEARNAVLVFTGSPASNANIIIPSTSKTYVVRNSTSSGNTITIKTSSGSGAVVANGTTALVYCDGTDCFLGAFPVNNSGSYTFTTLTTSGSMTVGNALVVSAGGADVTGATLLRNALTVYGATTLNNTLNVTGSSSLSSATVSSTLGVTGATTLSNTLSVSGAATMSSTLAVSGSISANSGSVLLPEATGGGSYRSLHNNSGTIGFLNTSSGWAFRVDDSGNATATGNVTAYSDARLKEDVVTIQDALSLVEAMRGVRYVRRGTGERQVGVIAQEVQAVLPEVVRDGDFLSVAYGNLTGVLIEAVKELSQRVKELEAR